MYKPKAKLFKIPSKYLKKPIFLCAYKSMRKPYDYSSLINGSQQKFSSKSTKKYGSGTRESFQKSVIVLTVLVQSIVEMVSKVQYSEYQEKAFPKSWRAASKAVMLLQSETVENPAKGDENPLLFM